jgi:putative transcriptional regulator
MLRSNLKVIIDEKGISQKQLAEMAGVSEGTIGKLCRDRVYAFSADVVIKICQVLDLSSLDELFEIEV